MNVVPERLYALARSQNAEKLRSWIWGAPRLSGAVLQKRMSRRWSSASLHAGTGHHSVTPSSAPADAGMIHMGSTSSEVNSQINSSRPCCLHILLIKQILAFYRLNAISNSTINVYPFCHPLSPMMYLPVTVCTEKHPFAVMQLHFNCSYNQSLNLFCYLLLIVNRGVMRGAFSRGHQVGDERTGARPRGYEAVTARASSSEHWQRWKQGQTKIN